MPVEYDLISDVAREGYELGSGVWYEDAFIKALRSTDPVGEVFAFLVEEDDYEPEYARKVASEIAAFAAAHPDWRVVSEQWDGAVVDGEWMAVLVDEGSDPMDTGYPLYRKVGSRYRQHEMPLENLTPRQQEVVMKYRAGKEK